MTARPSARGFCSATISERLTALCKDIGRLSDAEVKLQVLPLPPQSVPQVVKVLGAPCDSVSVTFIPSSKLMALPSLLTSGK